MSKKIGTALIIIGVVFVLSAVVLFAYNRYEETQAAVAAEGVLEQLQAVIVQDKKPEQTDPDDNPSTPSATELIVDPAMATLQVDGYHYIGYLSIPDLSLELPVMDSWDYKKLKIAPCHYYGSYKTDDLVIAGHNYQKHFGGLKNLAMDSPVYFTDSEGNIHAYKVVALEVLQPSDTLPMVESPFDLTLYTCTYGGRERITLRCKKM